MITLIPKLIYSFSFLPILPLLTENRAHVTHVACDCCTCMSCVRVCVSHLLVVIPPTLGLFAALSRGFGGGLYVESGEGC